MTEKERNQKLIFKDRSYECQNLGSLIWVQIGIAVARIKVIELIARPGGLGESLSVLRDNEGVSW